MEIEKIPELENIAQLFKSLKDNGIIRSKNLVGDLGEYYCKVLFNLALEENKVNRGYDAKDKNGNKIEIKTRRTPEDKNKVIFRSFDFQYCYFVILDDSFQPQFIYKIEVSSIKKALDKRGDRLSVKKMKTKTQAETVYPVL